jgi:hypothetical protein
MNGSEVAEFIEDALVARLEGRKDHLVELIDGLVSGPSMRAAAQVVCTMASGTAMNLTKRPGEDFYRFPTRLVTEPGGAPRKVSADDLPPWLRTYGQMTVAMANGDRDMAVALFVGYVSRRRGNAARLLAVGLNSLAHQVTCPDCCPDELLRGWEP